MEVAERLGVGTVPVVTHRNIQPAVWSGTEMKRAGIVNCRRLRGQIQQNRFASDDRHVTVCGEPTHTVVRRCPGTVYCTYTKWLVAKFGSRATPISPRSLVESTVTVRKGVASSTPFLITRSWPACRQTNTRPSGATAMAVAFGNPEAARMVSWNPLGSVAPRRGDAITVEAKTDARTRRPGYRR